jgi:D-lactate dehydrogenase (cytochrome)
MTLTDPLRTLAEPVLDALRAAVGATHVSIDPADRLLRSQDVFYWEEGMLVEAVVRPGSAEEVAAVLRLAKIHDFAVAPRGGGVSYTKGYVAERPGTVSLDLERLTEIHEVNVVDRYATVGAACSWERLAVTLAPHGLRTTLRGPISGGWATVGGVASQSTGSSAMSGFLSLEVVLPDGTLVRTGSGGRVSQPSPFYRDYGPDLTGLFLGDSGAYGVKTACTLALEPIPGGVAFASVAFESLGAMTEAMVAASRSGIPCRLFGMDPLKNRTATRVGIREGIATLAEVVKSAASVTSGLRQAAGIAAGGQGVLENVRWSLHVTVEAHDQETADRALAALKPCWSPTGRELPSSVPISLHARPYSIRGILGLEGERWVPVHGLFPFSRVPEVVARTEEFFEANRARLEAHGITHSYLTMSFARHWLLEPMFYWPDAPGPLHAVVLGPKFRRFADQAPNPAARAEVRALRSELATLFEELGAVHSQLGKFYRYGENLVPGTYTLLTGIKDLLDPGHRLNPGNLGWH